MSLFQHRYLTLLDSIHETAVSHGRNPKDITLIAVSKTASIEAIQDLYEAGCRDFGESKIPDALKKIEALPQDIRWHWIGRLQTNKVKKVLENFTLIHSIDDMDLLHFVSEQAGKLSKKAHILLQANTSKETSKQGLSPQEWTAVWKQLILLPHLEVEGLMTMAPLSKDQEIIRSTFWELKKLQSALLPMQAAHTPLRQLSMGMTRDWKIAIEEGATLLRVGSLIFQ